MNQHPVTHGESEPRGSLRALRPLDGAFNAGGRAPARASITAKANALGDPRANSGSPTEGDRTARLRRWITPPNPKTTAPPSWDQLLWHGDHGRQAPKEGWPRTGSVLWSRTVALPGRAAAVWLDWVSRSPSRCLVVFVLYALLAHLPGMGWLPWFY